MYSFIRSLRLMTRTRKAKRRFGVSFGQASIGFHVGRPSAYVFYKLPAHKVFNRPHLGTF